MSGKAETKSNLVSAEKVMKKSEFFSGETCFGHRIVSGFQGKFSAETGFARKMFRPFISGVSGVTRLLAETSFGRFGGFGLPAHVFGLKLVSGQKLVSVT